MVLAPPPGTFSFMTATPPLAPPMAPHFAPGKEMAACISFPPPSGKTKEEHAEAIEKHLKECSDRLDSDRKKQIEALHSQAAQEKSLHSLLVDQQVKQQELLLSQQYNQQLMMLTQAAQRQGAELEQQATNLMLDYQQKKVEEDFVASQAGVEKQFSDMQKQFAEELAKSSLPAPPVVPPVLGSGVAGPVLPSPQLVPPIMPNLSGKLPYPPPPVPTLVAPAVRGPSTGMPAPSFGQAASTAAAFTLGRAGPQLSFAPSLGTAARPMPVSAPGGAVV